jgi:hypothetical protein
MATELFGGTMQFTQEADDCSNSSALQILTFEVCDGGAGKYVRFTTEGWAIDSLNDFAELYKKVKVAFEMKEQSND